MIPQLFSLVVAALAVFLPGVACTTLSAPSGEVETPADGGGQDAEALDGEMRRRVDGGVADGSPDDASDPACDSADPAGAACPDPGPCRVRRCADGMCVPEVAGDGTACAGGVCAGGGCADCVRDADCTGGSTPFCQDNMCVACREAGDCTVSETCRVATCEAGACGSTLAGRGAPCARGGVCNARGDCVECVVDGQCDSPRPRCDAMAGACVECATEDDCRGEFELCVLGACTPGPGCGNNVIDVGEACDPTVSNDWHCSAQCTIAGSETAWTRCTSNAQCRSDEICVEPLDDPISARFCAPSLRVCSSVFPEAFPGSRSVLFPPSGFCALSCSVGRPCPSHTECRFPSSCTGSACSGLCLPG